MTLAEDHVREFTRAGVRAGLLTEDELLIPLLTYVP